LGMTDLERIVDLREHAMRKDAKWFDEALITLVADIRADERERCAKACEQLGLALLDEWHRFNDAKKKGLSVGVSPLAGHGYELAAMTDCAQRIRGGW